MISISSLLYYHKLFTQFFTNNFMVNTTYHTNHSNPTHYTSLLHEVGKRYQIITTHSISLIATTHSTMILGNHCLCLFRISGPLSAYSNSKALPVALQLRMIFFPFRPELHHFTSLTCAIVPVLPHTVNYLFRLLQV